MHYWVRFRFTIRQNGFLFRSPKHSKSCSKSSSARFIKFSAFQRLCYYVRILNWNVWAFSISEQRFSCTIFRKGHTSTFPVFKVCFNMSTSYLEIKIKLEIKLFLSQRRPTKEKIDLKICARCLFWFFLEIAVPFPQRPSAHQIQKSITDAGLRLSSESDQIKYKTAKRLPPEFLSGISIDREMLRFKGLRQKKFQVLAFLRKALTS